MKLDYEIKPWMFWLYVYVLGIFLTFGYEAHNMDSPAASMPTQGASAFVFAIVWPVYWFFRLSYLAFQ